MHFQWPNIHSDWWIFSMFSAELVWFTVERLKSNALLRSPSLSKTRPWETISIHLTKIQAEARISMETQIVRSVKKTGSSSKLYSKEQPAHSSSFDWSSETVWMFESCALKPFREPHSGRWRSACRAHHRGPFTRTEAILWPNAMAYALPWSHDLHRMVYFMSKIQACSETKRTLVAVQRSSISSGSCHRSCKPLETMDALILSCHAMGCKNRLDII